MNSLPNLASIALALVVLAAPAAAADSVLLRLFFNEGSAELTAGTVEKLTQSVPVLQKSFQWQQIEIAGHTDSTADETTNLALSRQRAQAVYNFLAEQGLKMDNMTIRGYGETEPMVPEVDRSARARNRRVELKLLNVPEPGDLDFPPE